MMKYSIVLILLGANFLFLSAQEKTRIYYADKELVPRERFVDFSQLKLEERQPNVLQFLENK
jgi:hypothetical protein